MNIYNDKTLYKLLAITVIIVIVFSLIIAYDYAGIYGLALCGYIILAICVYTVPAFFMLRSMITKKIPESTVGNAFEILVSLPFFKSIFATVTLVYALMCVDVWANIQDGFFAPPPIENLSELPLSMGNPNE